MATSREPRFRVSPRRYVGHPLKRWDDAIVQLAGSDWLMIARDGALWAVLSLMVIFGGSAAEPGHDPPSLTLSFSIILGLILVYFM